MLIFLFVITISSRGAHEMSYRFNMGSLWEHVIYTDLTQLETGSVQAQRIIRKALRITRHVNDLP
jgi:hypothetical protein